MGQKPNKHLLLQSVQLDQQSQQDTVHTGVVLLHTATVEYKRIMPLFISVTHTGCRAFTSKAIQRENKTQFCSTSLVIPLHEAFRINMQKGAVSPLRNTDKQPDSETNIHFFQMMCIRPVEQP